MKKLVSLFAALAMVSTIFASVACAIPESAKLYIDVKEADATQISTYESAVDTVPAGYTLYVVTVSQSGLGAFTNANTGTSGLQLKKPNGFLPINMTFKWVFDAANFAKIYPDVDYVYVQGNAYNFKPSYSDTSRSISAYIDTITNGTDPYPLNATGKTTIAEKEALVEIYVLATGEFEGTLDEGTLFNMCQMQNGANQAISGSNVVSNQAKYSIGNGLLTLAAEEPGVVAPAEEIVAKAAGTTGLTDLDGNEVPALDADYGIAKFDTNINTALNKYYLVAKTASATSPLTDDWLVDFGGATIEAGGDIEFYAVVKSTHGPITSLTLKAVANE